MSISTEIITSLLPIIIDGISIVILFLFAFLSSYFVKIFPIYKKKMRIIYGYIAIIVLLLALLFYVYFINPFIQRNYLILFFRFNPLSGAFYILSTAILVILSFHTIVETEFQSDKDCTEFIIILTLQTASYILFFASNWVVLFFGLVFCVFLINLYLHALYDNQEEKTLKYLLNYLIFNGLALSLMFLGLSSLYFSSLSFQFSPNPIPSSKGFWEALGLTLVISSSFIFIGNVPCHHWLFHYKKYRSGSISLLLTVFQRVIGFALLVYSFPIFTQSVFYEVIGWLFIIFGTLALFYGTLASITENYMEGLLFYLNLVFIGLFLLIAGQYILSLDYETKKSIAVILSYYLFAYVLTFIFAISSHQYIFQRYKTNDFTKLKGLGRQDILRYLPFLFVLLISLAFPFTGSFFFYYFVVKALSWSGSVYLFVILLIGFVLSTVCFVRYVRYVFIEPSSKSTEILTYRVEMGIGIATLLSALVLIGLSFLADRFVDFCKMASIFFLNP
ncbi:MAG: hypothetical protein ACTSYD_01615 [Candidatus Heimdallarchaeaceae archaeon]